MCSAALSGWPPLLYIEQGAKLAVTGTKPPLTRISKMGTQKFLAGAYYQQPMVKKLDRSAATPAHTRIFGVGYPKILVEVLQHPNSTKTTITSYSEL